MFYIFYENGELYKKTHNEVEADTMAYQIGGYYVESGVY